MITLDKRIESLALYMERTERVMFLISVGAPSWTVIHNIGLVGESASELKDSLQSAEDTKNVIKVAYEMYLDQREDEDV